MSDDNQRIASPRAPAAAPPAGDPAFRWTHEAWGVALRASLLERHAQHLFTSSQLRLPANASSQERDHAWRAVSASLGASPERLLRVRQVHGRLVRVARADDPSSLATGRLPDGDAIVSNAAGAVLAVVVADCVPLLMADARIGAAAAVHAGWRGTCAGVATSAVEAMRAAFGTRPDDLHVAIGPSIGPADYQVGETVVEAFRAAGHGGSFERWFSRAGGLRLDLWQANLDQLETAGVRRDRIAVAGLSTAAHPGWLESFRRDGAAAGRLVAAIVVPAGGSAQTAP